MMTLYEKIIAIYPQLTPQDFLTTVRVRNDLDERGEYIDHWAHPTLVQPTEEQLAAVTEPPPVVPERVTMRQARMALLGAGLLAQVNAAVAAMPGVAGEAARIEWEYSSEVFRYRPLVLGLASALGLTQAQLDALFINAAKIQ